MRLYIVSILFFFSQSSLGQNGIEKYYKIYNTQTKQLTTVEQIAIDCKNADVLFFGEEHNDSAGHYLEAVIFKAMHKEYGDKLALSMEMFETDCQLVLNEYLNGFISEVRFVKEARAWNNYKDYKPAVEFAKQNKLPVIAANPPRRYVSMVSSNGMNSLAGLPKSSKRYLPPLPYDTLSGRYYEKFQGFMGGGSPGTNNPKIYYSQSLWDAGMSYSIYKFWKKNKDKKIFHLVGRFHSDEKLGTAAQLQNRNPKLKILNISCFSDKSFENPDWEKFKHLGDYVIITDPDLKKTY
jgi:uncharacterized iron-regulated protein